MACSGFWLIGSETMLVSNRVPLGHGESTLGCTSLTSLARRSLGSIFTGPKFAHRPLGRIFAGDALGRIHLLQLHWPPSAERRQT
jgi:hypothetical protein